MPVSADRPMAADQPAPVASPVLTEPPIATNPMDTTNPIAVSDPPISVDPTVLAKAETAAEMSETSNPPDADDPVVTMSIETPIDAEQRQRKLIAFEMEMSARALTYVLDATRGRVDPNRISGYHDLPRKQVDLAEALHILAESDDVIAYLQSRSPSGAHFKKLAEELVALKNADDGRRIEIAPGTLIKPGKPNEELANVVAAIRLHSSAELKEKHAETLEAYQGSPEYTPELIELVKDFQREKKLKPDGIVGRNTIRAMVGETNAAKIAKLKLAMERARWLPAELGERHVFVNQPAFTASFYRPDNSPLVMRVVVGKKSNQTSFFVDKIETVEFNPYWGVPLSIIVNEMMPKLNEDPGYLDRIGYEVTTTSGQRVSSASVDWYAVATKSQSINVRQLPGRGNALGELKILFPNKHDIYMHDTPAKALFSRDNRAFSHGCIRLQDPRAMAAAVLGKSTDYVASRIAQGKNDSDPVTFDIPVYISYFTAWPNAGGTVEYFDDVYDRDVYLSRAVEATSKTRQKDG
ncbi:MAG: L,D-transpeptidase family protein [Hyphomicrobiales bacterium]|nr:L,D-transpeptidase family protein [Hyphomicrobiales bacterium]